MGHELLVVEHAIEARLRREVDTPVREPGHDPYARNLTAKDIRRIVKGMDIVREELGPDIDFAIECHWRYDVHDVIELAKALDDA